jgi:ABC-type Zn uptake system ZnuABC Zn-binding protein ZnuA
VAGRTLVIRSDDVLIVNGYELDGEVLKAIVSPDKRLLWAFIKKDHDIRPVAYSEDKVIWLTDEDLVRK